MKNILKIVLIWGIFSSFSFGGEELTKLNKAVYGACLDRTMEMNTPKELKKFVCECSVNVVKSAIKNDQKARFINNVTTGKGDFTQEQQDILFNFIAISIDMCAAFDL